MLIDPGQLPDIDTVIRVRPCSLFTIRFCLARISSMARPLRIEYPYAIYHVMSRGNGRQAIFHSDGDYERMTDGLEKTVGRTDWRVLAYASKTPGVWGQPQGALMAQRQNNGNRKFTIFAILLLPNIKTVADPTSLSYKSLQVSTNRGYGTSFF